MSDKPRVRPVSRPVLRLLVNDPRVDIPDNEPAFSLEIGNLLPGIGDVETADAEPWMLEVVETSIAVMENLKGRLERALLGTLMRKDREKRDAVSKARKSLTPDLPPKPEGNA